MSDSVQKVLGNLSSNSRGAVDLMVKVGIRTLAASESAEGMDFRTATLAAEREETNQKLTEIKKVDEVVDNCSDWWREVGPNRGTN